MDLTTRVQMLERAIGRLGIRLLEEELPEEAHIDGGLCTVAGERVLFLSPHAPPWRRAEVLLEALRRLPHEQIWLPPEIRRVLGGEDFGNETTRLIRSKRGARRRADGEEDER